MYRYLAKKVMIAFFTLIVISIVIFSMLHLAPGNPLDLVVSPMASQEIRQKVAQEIGLNKPLYIQYFTFIKNILHGYLGESLMFRKPVVSLIIQRFPATLILTATALTISFIVAIFLGILAALKQNTGVDRGIMGLVVIGMAIPNFWFALLLVLIFGLKLGLFPISGFTSWKHLVLPGIALSVEPVASTTRMMRSSMLEVIRQDYMRALKAKGISKFRLIWIHGLKNGIISIITLLGLRIGWLIGGNVIVEYVFAWPGLGRLLVDSIIARDYLLVQGIMLVVSFLIVGGNLLADILYALVDPRIRYQ